MITNSPSSPAVVAALPQESFLQRTLERLSGTQCLTVREEKCAPVAVIAIQKYLSEQNAAQQTDCYSYDVTVTDGVWRAKCFLHPSLNHLVHTNTLRTGDDIRITQCSFIYNERVLGHGYVCIKEVRCGAGRSVLLQSVQDVSSLPLLVKRGMEMSLSLQSDVPLQVSRRHYLPLWNNDDPEGDIWISGPLASDTVLDAARISLLSNLESSQRNTWRPLPLLVRIIHKSRLRYYGRFGLRIDYPFQAYFEVADQSGIMSLVLWNELCPEFYQRLKVGAVLYLQSYTLKQSYSNRSHPQIDHHKMKKFSSVEICLNARNPASVITVIPPKSVLPQWGLPDVSYHFITRAELENLPDKTACDIIGLVTFVGRVERVKYKGNKGPERYWTYRWIHAIDGTSDQPFVLELFSSSQPEIFTNICPMTYLVCTQMRVCLVEGSMPYLTSSCETETFITGYHKGQPYVADSVVKNFIQWTKTLKDNVVLQKTAVSGYYCYPQPPLRSFQSLTDASAQPLLVTATDLKRELESLHYREHKRLAIQGHITAVRYMRGPQSTQCLEREEVPRVDTGECSVSEAQRSQAAAEQTSEASLASESPNRRKRRIKPREDASPTSSLPVKRQAGIQSTEREQEERQDSDCEHGQDQSVESDQAPPSKEPDVLSWQSSSWVKQREELSEHLCRGGLFQDSVAQSFTFDEKDELLQLGNLQPTRWTAGQSDDLIQPAMSSGYYQITVLGINKQIAVDAAYFPVLSSTDPRSVGLHQEAHDNTMLSCLSSGFLCPLSDSTAAPLPGEMLATAGELEDLHVVCVLDLCHLGEEQVEIALSKVYRVAEVCDQGEMDSRSAAWECVGTGISSY